MNCESLDKVEQHKMSSHIPGFSGLPLIPGLAGSSSVLGQALTHGDRRRQETDNKNLLSIPGKLCIKVILISH